ncbi:MAG: glycosyltransferase family 4 protein [Verrucomicrobia bacterium]|nr:glycosyltransferase family 4 protein [Verrucomicrobiota bacterium]
MKLALIRRQFSATGGAELYLQRLLGALAAQRHELHLFTERWDEPLQNVTPHPVLTSGSRAERPLRFAEAVQRELAKEQFDCVFSLERTLQQDVYRAGDGVHRVWLERRREFAPWWKRPFLGGEFHRNMMALEAQTFDPARTRRIIVNSEMVRREILRHFHFPEERLHLVRNGVDVERFQGGNRALTRARFGVRENEFLLLFVGSGWERKGLYFLLEAMRDVVAEEVKLLVVGRGRPPIHAPANVIFAGPMVEVENAYAAADLFVFPPIYEPCANVVFEALAAGLPVVTTAQNGAGELIQNGHNGTVLASPANTDLLLAAIEYWRQHAGRVTTNEDLSLERNVRETLAVLELAARERQRG